MKSFLFLSSLVGTSLSAAVPRNAAPEPAPQVLGDPTRTVQESPTPFPWWPWWPPHTIDTPPRVTSFPRNAAPEPEPQVLGSPSRTLQEAPTPPFPWWWHGWPTATPVDTVPRNAAPEPQVLGSPSRTNQVLPTPPFPWWWNQWPGATPAAVNERDADEKREPQTLNLGSSRTVQVWPHTTVVPPGHKHTSTPYEIDQTVTLPALTLDKRDPQTLDWTISRTNQVTPTGPATHHHHPTTVSTVYVTVTETPYEIDATLTLEPLTLNKKREPQTLGPISRTVEISPTGPSRHHHTSVSTVYVTVTEYEPVDKKRSPQTLELGSRTNEVFPTGTEINIPLTLPYDPLQTIIGKDKRVAEASPAKPTSPPKENPCQNNIFPPPAWCFNPTSVVTVTVTVTATPSASATPSITAISTITNLFETTVTLPVVTLTAGSPPWTRKERRSRQRV